MDTSFAGEDVGHVPQSAEKSLTYDMVQVMGHIVVVTGTKAVTMSGEALVHSSDSVSQPVTVICLYEYTVDFETAGMTSTTTILVAKGEEPEVEFGDIVAVELPCADATAY